MTKPEEKHIYLQGHEAHESTDTGTAIVYNHQGRTYAYIGEDELDTHWYDDGLCTWLHIIGG